MLVLVDVLVLVLLDVLVLVLLDVLVVVPGNVRTAIENDGIPSTTPAASPMSLSSRQPAPRSSLANTYTPAQASMPSQLLKHKLKGKPKSSPKNAPGASAVLKRRGQGSWLTTP